MAGHHWVIHAGVAGASTQEARSLHYCLDRRIVLPVWVGERKNRKTEFVFQVRSRPLDFVRHTACGDGSERDMASCVCPKANATMQHVPDIRIRQEGSAGQFTI